MDIKLPGLNTGNFHFHIPGGDIRISGKWFNYGIIFIVMILDLNMWKNQIFYEPFVYGQYTDDQDYIYTVTDRDFLANATEETLSYAWRWSHVNPLTNETYGLQDLKMNSRYFGVPLSVKGTAFIPSLFSFALFGILVKYFSKGGPPVKVAPSEVNDATDGASNELCINGREEDDVEMSSSSPNAAASHESITSTKSALTANKARNLGSFLSIDSSHDGLDPSRNNLDSSRDNLDSSRDALRSSRDNLESLRDDVRSSVGSLGIAPETMTQPNSSRPAWSAASPMITLPDASQNRRDDCVDTEKSIKHLQCSNDDQDNENMVQELVQELSFLNLEDEDRQAEEKKESDGNSLPVSDDKPGVLPIGDLFRRDPPSSSRSLSQSSVASSDDEGLKPDVKAKKSFLQVPRPK